MAMICESCKMLTQPYRDGTCEFCGKSVIVAADLTKGKV